MGQPPLQPGRVVIGGRYEILRHLGSGGMGVVYLAFDRERRSEVALKTLRDFEPAALYRLKREFRSLSDVVHPNLAALYELVSEHDTWFVTMEYVDGTSFIDYVRPRAAARSAQSGSSSSEPSDSFARAPTQDQRPDELKQLNVEAALRTAGGPLPSLARLRPVLSQLADGVSALHAAGQLHRDLKPSNVLVSRQDRVVILDFGLATELAGAARQASAEGIVGTVDYMSPEQAAGLPLTEASDWYSVGVTLFEALTGRRPFLGGIAEVLRDKQVQAAPRPSDVTPGVPEELDRLTVELLERRPEARPIGPEVRRRLGAASAPRSPRLPPPAGSALLGRERHLAVLQDALRMVRAGHAVARLVRGRSGMGKSALVQAFLEGLDGGDAVVLAGRCYERESVPYKALDTVVDELSKHLMRLPAVEAAAVMPRYCAALARLFPVLNRVEAFAEAPRRLGEVPDPQELRRRAFAALRELFTRLGDRCLLVVYVDDLQWGDLDSAALFSELLRPPNPPAFLLIVCCRDEDIESDAVLRSLLEPFRTGQLVSDIAEIEVGPLSRAEAGDMALSQMRAAGPSGTLAAERIAEESGGNPFFVAELVRHLEPDGTVAAGLGIAGGSISLDEALQARIRRLPDDAFRLLTAVAVAGRPVSTLVAEQAAGLETHNQGALGHLRAGHLVKTRGARRSRELEAYHDRIRENVVRLLSEKALEDWHRRLASALEGAANLDHEILAVHFRGAGMRERAAEHSSLAAAAAANALAFERAARLYRSAIELRSDSDPQLRSHWALLGQALACAGRGPEAAQAYQRAAEGSTVAENLEYRRRAAEQLLRSGHVDEGLAVLETVLQAVGMRLPKSPAGALMSLLFRHALLAVRGLGFKPRDTSQVPPAVLTQIDVCWTVAVGLARIDNIRAADFQKRHLLLALRAGEPYRIARALATEAGFSSTGGARTRKRTERLQRAADELVARLGHPHAIGLAKLAAGLAAYYHGSFRRALESCEEAEAIFRDRCTGVAWEINTTAIYVLASLYYLGETGELVRRLPLRLSEARERGDLYAAVDFAAGRSALGWLVTDEVARARQEVSEAMRTWSRRGFHSQHLWALFAQVHLELYVGDPQTARRLLEERWPEIARSLIVRVKFVLVEILGLRARCALALAAVSPASAPGLLAAAERDARRISRQKLEISQPFARLIEAGASALRGRRERALETLGAATLGFERLDMALYAAAARWRKAQLLGQGPEQEAAEAFMRDQAIKKPERILATLAPGFPDHDGRSMVDRGGIEPPTP